MQHILIIDDDPADTELIRASLAGVVNGARIEAVTSAAEGLEAISRNPPDLAIVDVRMPGMNGLETCGKIKSIAPRIKVITISGMLESFNLDIGRDVGVDGCVSKSSMRDDLPQAVRQLMHDSA